MNTKTCTYFKNQIYDAIDSRSCSMDLSGDLSLHLKECKNCKNFYERLLSTKESLASLEPVPFPKTFDEHFSKKLEEEPKPKKPIWLFFERRPILIPAWSFATVLIIAFIAIFSVSRKPESDWAMNSIVSHEIDLYQNLELLENLDELADMEKTL